MSQNIALDFASPIDHYIKDVCRIKGYGRYMDDGYVISESLDELKRIRDDVTKLATSLGLEINQKKNIITPFKNHSFHFLKMRIRLESSGKVVMKLSRDSIKAIRRKLKIFRKWVSDGSMSVENVFSSYQSWRAHARRCNSYKTLRSMDIYFVSLFRNELSERKDRFKCTLKSNWNPEIGWIYYRSKEEYRKVLQELDNTREMRESNGFIPLHLRPDWVDK